MRKFISLVLAVAMLVSAVGIVTAYAEDYREDGDTFANSTVTFRQPSSYCIFIPDMIGLDYDYQISGSDMNISDRECLRVLLSGLDSENHVTFESLDGTATLKKSIEPKVLLNGGTTLSDLGCPSNCVGYFLKGDTMSEVAFGLSEGYSDFHSNNGMTQPPAGEYFAPVTFEISLNSF